MDNKTLQTLLHQQLDIREIGINMQMSGFILASKDTVHMVYFPNEMNFDSKDINAVIPNIQEYEAIVRQMDLQEIELIDENTYKKTVIRKSQRSMDQGVVWKVFARDNYTCRYCGTKGVPMTFDHIKLWEENGDTTEENGVCACRKCNKTRGNMDYEDWINSKYYLDRSVNLDSVTILHNKKLVEQYKSFPDKISKRKR